MSQNVPRVLRWPPQIRTLTGSRLARDSGGARVSRWELVCIGTLGALAAGVVGRLTAENPLAAPSHVAVGLRVALILTLVGTAIYVLSGRGAARMGLVLLAAAAYCTLWLLNGARAPTAFSVGLLAAGAAPTVFAYLVLAYPRGRLRYVAQRRLLAGAGGALLVLWTLAVLTHAQPPTKTPLVQCLPHCPRNAFFIGSIGSGAFSVISAGIFVTWTAVACGTPLVFSRFVGTAPPSLREGWRVVEAAVWANAAAWVAFVVAHAAGSGSMNLLGALYVISALAIPLAILARLAIDRTLMGRSLARFVDQIASRPELDLQSLMGGFLNDPSLRIAYLEPGTARYADAAGDPIAVPRSDPNRAVAWIDMARGPVAAVIYDARLSDHAGFVHAAGAAASLRVEAANLEAELEASTRQLEASRLRLLEAAHAERQRIERDLHDGVQQQVVGLRLKLELAAEVMETDPSHGRRMLDSVGSDLDELLRALRSLAKGIYPPILTERGLREALGSAAMAAPVPVALTSSHVGRVGEDTEVAVYFCCVEAIQNVAKHAGPAPEVTIRLWQSADWLRFEVSDHGCGFDPEAVAEGSGLINMKDRIEAVGGKLWVSSQPGAGTRVRGKVPATPAQP